MGVPRKAVQKGIFFFIFLNFNWRLITLQYCIGFALYQHESFKVQGIPGLPPPTLIKNNFSCDIAL